MPVVKLKRGACTCYKVVKDNKIKTDNTKDTLVANIQSVYVVQNGII
jgi:hypothetical protein